MHDFWAGLGLPAPGQQAVGLARDRIGLDFVGEGEAILGVEMFFDGSRVAGGLGEFLVEEPRRPPAMWGISPSNTILPPVSALKPS